MKHIFQEKPFKKKKSQKKKGENLQNRPVKQRSLAALESPVDSSSSAASPKKESAKVQSVYAANHLDVSEVDNFDTETQIYLRNGLTEGEVRKRIAAGAVNEEQEPLTRSYEEIIKDNVFTLFNFLNFFLAFLILIASVMNPVHLRNLTFLGVVFVNLVIGIIQEVKAKETVDNLSILVEPNCKVLREGKIQEISVYDLVIDDIILLENGVQVSVDTVFIEGSGFEVDESQLTGEADSVIKKPGDPVYSGSLVVAGAAKLRVTRVGADTYAAKLAAEAKREKVQRSELRYSLHKIIRLVSIIILPIGVALAFSKYHQSSGAAIDEVIVSSVAALIGMIPEGLILLTEIAFAGGTTTLAKHHILVQTMPAIEMLARLDVLCLDKTGTLTSGNMRVSKVLPLDQRYSQQEYHGLLSSIARATRAKGGTQRAIENYFQTPNDWHVTRIINFSSARKWSSVSFAKHGCFFLGASEFILSPEKLAPYQELIKRESEQGHRLLLLAHSDTGFSGNDVHVPADTKPLALVVLVDEIRDDAPKTLEYFRRQNVEIKIISGDSPQTVSSIAKRVGLQGADRWIDMSKVPHGSNLREVAENYTVFGRVNPYQKRALLQALQSNGHTVGMTGDGVNDVPALREADCSIAMVSGSDAARRVSDIVLLNNNMSALIPGVYEGRSIINNIERVATLFLVKTIYSSLLSFLFIFIQHPYPVFPIQVTLVSSCTIGIPAFFLALKPNFHRIRGNFLQKVFSKALPGGLSAVFMMVFVTYFGAFLDLNYESISTLATLALGTVGFVVLTKVSAPLNWSRLLLIGTLIVAFIGALLVFPELFAVKHLLSNILFLGVAVVTLAAVVTNNLLDLGSKRSDSKLKRLLLRWGKQH